jgi:sporulation protein YlmC with PRC-barrel domain
MENQVLISPYALGPVLRGEQSIVVNLTKKQIENSPPLSSNKPVSRQFEESYYMYYGWPMYWNGPYAWGSYPYPYLSQSTEDLAKEISDEKAWDPHLCSAHDVAGYHVQASDGEIGHVDDFVIDDKTWTIRYLIIDTQNWWPGKKVLISPKWIDPISWSDSKIFVKLTRESIQESPEYTGPAMLTREYENSLHKHYNREGYWSDEPLAVSEHPR